VRLVARLVFRLRIENPPRLPGAFVVIANHASLVDPLVLGAALGRRSVFLMTVLHFRSAWLGWFYRWQRAIPLALRAANRESLRTARAVLAAGTPVVIFPEGGMSRDGGLLLGNPGAVSLVLSEDVPVVPAYIDGAARAVPLGGLPRPAARIVVRFGEPIAHQALLAEAGDGDRRSRHRRETRMLMDRIAALGGVESRESFLERIGRPVLATEAPIVSNG
jgi:1-acyl-sn-glycerol-3-phosphate acyltransferase